MAFLFNFPNPGDSKFNINDDFSKQQNDLPVCKDFFCDSPPCDIFFATKVTLPDSDVLKISIGHHEIKHISVSSAMKKENKDTLLEEIKLSDIVPRKYEGGLKIWECSMDLAKFLTEHKCVSAGDEVLELGCGAGLPGLLAYIHGAFVTFQDFNAEVLHLVTIPNVTLNSPPKHDSDSLENCCFMNGDWSAIKDKFFSNASEKRMYDLILTSETIYDKQSHRKLLDLMKCALKPQGTIYLAAKIHYFGVGGGISDFELLVEKDDVFKISTVVTIADGVERRILRMKFKQDKIPVYSNK